jgi:hypothetical protein
MCHPDANTTFESSGNWTVYTDGSYEWYRVKYTNGQQGNACAGEQALVVKSVGKVQMSGGDGCI